MWCEAFRQNQKFNRQNALAANRAMHDIQTTSKDVTIIVRGFLTTIDQVPRHDASKIYQHTSSEHALQTDV